MSLFCKNFSKGTSNIALIAIDWGLNLKCVWPSHNPQREMQKTCISYQQHTYTHTWTYQAEWRSNSQTGPSQSNCPHPQCDYTNEQAIIGCLRPFVIGLRRRKSWITSGWDSQCNCNSPNICRGIPPDAYQQLQFKYGPTMNSQFWSALTFRLPFYYYILLLLTFAHACFLQYMW